MPSLRRSLASISALSTFEAAARLESFTRAAAELGVTQAAVSRQIRALETDLGTALFQRGHRRVELTRAGALLSVAVSTGFDRIAETVETIRQSRSEADVAVGATLAFSHFWLLPRLTGFRRIYPNAHMRLISQDERFDWRRADAQIVVRYGSPPAAGENVLVSMQDTIFPVCSPEFLAAHGQPATDDALFSFPLIASDWVDPTWPTWSSWAEDAGVGRPKLHIALRFTHYIDTIHAAMNGQGVALGWGRLLSRPLGEGRLVRLGALSVGPVDGYYVVTAEGQRIGRATQQVIDWFAAEFAQAAQDA